MAFGKFHSCSQTLLTGQESSKCYVPKKTFGTRLGQLDGPSQVPWLLFSTCFLFTCISCSAMTNEDLFLSSCIDDNFICIKIDPRQKRRMGKKRVLTERN